MERIFRHVTCVRAVIAKVSECTGILTEEEQASVEQAVDKRRREFTAGRALAKRALAGLGEKCLSIPVHRNRYPEWPRGVVGSISHTSELVAAAVAKESEVPGVGIDVELGCSVTPDLYPTLFSKPERAAIDNSPGDTATLLFSCKESVYKAVFPKFEEFLDFDDVQVEIKGSQFWAVCTPSKLSARAIRQGRGYFTHYAGHVVTMFQA